MTNEQADIVARKMLLSGNLTNEEDEALDVLLEANDYRIAKKPTHIQGIPFSELNLGNCPKCGEVVRDTQRFCDWCGQKLKWEDEEC